MIASLVLALGLVMQSAPTTYVLRDGPGPLALFVRAPVGAWVTYRLSGGPGRTAYWRIAVVSAGKGFEGRAKRWVELSFGIHPKLEAPLAQLKVLVDERGLCRAVLAVGVARPRELSKEGLSRVAHLPWLHALSHLPGAAATVEQGRRALLMTGGGAVTALPLSFFSQGVVVEKVYLSREVPVLGLARLELPGVEVMEADAWGMDAVASLQIPESGVPLLHLRRDSGDDWPLPPFRRRP